MLREQFAPRSAPDTAPLSPGLLVQLYVLALATDARNLMNDALVTPRPELIGCFAFPAMDRARHLRPGFGFGISMCSSRIYDYESINGENLHGWFTGDGMAYLYNSDLNQFADAFWPTVNPYRLPGTTTPNAYSVAPMTANAPYVAIR